jgi:hypothetical protein
MSCKLSNTAISFIESEGLDATDFLMDLPWSDSLLLDPGQNLPVAEMETFFCQFLVWWENKKGSLQDTTEFLKSVGRNSYECRSWGTLDSVLRMMPDVFEVWQRPSKLLGHFVDPEPVVTDLNKERKRIRFMWPQAPQLYPYSFSVLLGCLEVLPKYMGADFAYCFYDQGYFYFDLAPIVTRLTEAPSQDLKPVGAVHSNQVPLVMEKATSEAGESLTQVSFNMKDATTEVALSNEEALFNSLSLSPEAFREMVAVVEKPLSSNRKTRSKESFQGPKQLTLQDSFGDSEPDLHVDTQEADLESLQQNLSRIVDFFIRATQLVKLMAQYNPEKAKKWMRRLNWEKVQEEFPGLIEESVTLVKQLKAPEDRRN